jgi:hypothetical protein
MALERVAPFLLLVATLLVATASIFTVAFKRPGWRFFDSRVSTLAIIRDPSKYVREPYARAVQTLGIAGLVLGVATIVSLIVWQLLR